MSYDLLKQKTIYGMNSINEVLKFPPFEKLHIFDNVLSTHNIVLSMGRSNMRILDVGGGKGKNRGLFTSSGHEYIILDINEQYADVVADMHEIPFDDMSFDAILSTSALQYSIDLPKVFGEVHRVLKDGGTFTGSIAFLEPWTWGCKCQCSPEGLYSLLCDSKFDIEFIWPSWNVFEALITAFQKKTAEDDKILLALQIAAQSFKDLCKKTPFLQWEFAGSINFHVRKS